MQLILGDCLEKLKELPDNSIDSVVTDPPYGLSFMGKKWDYDVPSVEIWRECLRVLKPGGYLLAFAGTRTQHRMAVRIEDAGFEVRDMITWAYGQGFPKSLNVFKQLQKKCECGNMGVYENRTKQVGANSEKESEYFMRFMQESDLSQTKPIGKEQGEVLQSGLSEQSSHSTVLRQESKESSEGREERILEGGNNNEKTEGQLQGSDLSEVSERVSTDGEERRIYNATQVSDGTTPEQTTNENGSSTPHRPQSEQQQYKQPCAFCKQWGTQATRTLGVGSALKPSIEPICFARKPLEKGLTIAENVLKYGTGGINVDGCRVESTEETRRAKSGWQDNGYVGGEYDNEKYDAFKSRKNNGRFPANLIHDGSDEVVEMFPHTKSGKAEVGTGNDTHSDIYGKYAHKRITSCFADEGSASRFFYCAKSSRRDRNDGLDGTLTVKYNSGVCHEENMVAVQLLEKVISDTVPVSFNIGESGASIMAQCHQDSLSTTLTKIKQTIELKTFSLLTLSLTSESTQAANSEMENGGSLVKSADSLLQWLLGITNGQMELALGASRVASQMLQAISNEDAWKPMTNIHSTVKPTDLMRYLCRLVTPKGGTILDPFMGSGSTGKGAKLEGFDFTGIELDPEYFKLAEARINAVSPDAWKYAYR